MSRRKLTIEERRSRLLQALVASDDLPKFRPVGARKRPREICATDLKLDWSRWEGPKLHFADLLGSGGVWDGPDHTTVEVRGEIRCRGCGHLQRMPRAAYCLHCDRCGREDLIPASGLPAHDVDDVQCLKGGLD